MIIRSSHVLGAENLVSYVTCRASGTVFWGAFGGRLNIFVRYILKKNLIFACSKITTNLAAMTDKELINDIKVGNLKPVYLLTGDENHYIDVVSDYIENNIVDPSLRDFDQTVLYGKDVAMADVIGNAKRFPVMSPVHVVLVKEAQDIDIKQWDAVANYLKQPVPQTMLVFCYRHKKLDKRTAAYKAIAKVGVVFEASKLYDNQVPTWIRNNVQSNGFVISEKAVMMLADYLGSDLAKVSNELSKLYPLIPSGGEITEQLVEQQVGISKDFNVFELQNAIGRRDPVMCNRIINYFAANPKKNPIQPILAVLYGYFLKIMYYHQLENKSDAAKVLGCPPSFVKDYAQAAANYSLGKLASCIGYLYEADLRSKGVRNSGNVTDGEILKEMIFKIIH